jgi:hypothetical protein
MTRLCRLRWRAAWVARRRQAKERVKTPVALWRGPSSFDPTVSVMAVVCAAGRDPSENRKTGDMLQVAVFRNDMPPARAWREGKDDAVCPETCIHRSKARGGQGSCYVNKGRLRSAWAAGAKQEPLRAEQLPDFGRGALLRLGMEGDPSAVPFWVWGLLVSDALDWAGYTADWRELGPRWQRLFMASCSSAAEAEEAEARGWRSFTGSVSVEEDRLHKAAGRRVCPSESISLTCVQCGGCNGLSGGSKRPSFHLPLHGAVGAALRRRAPHPSQVLLPFVV